MATLGSTTKNILSAIVSYLQKEDGDYLLQENGDKLIIKFGQIARLLKN